MILMRLARILFFSFFDEIRIAVVFVALDNDIEHFLNGLAMIVERA